MTTKTKNKMNEFMEVDKEEGEGGEGGGEDSSSEADDGSEGEKTFHLNTSYVWEMKAETIREKGREKWDDKGKVELPFKGGFTKIVVEDLEEENLAEEIKKLGLNANPVRKIEGVEKLTRVKEIDFHFCGLKFVPRWIKEKLPELEELDLSWNKIEKISAWITQVETLKSLDVAGNQS